jgi:hypothetical protein
LQQLHRPEIARLIDHGRFEGRAFEVWEHVEGRTLGEFRHELIGDPERIEQIAFSLIRALAIFEQRGLRHGSLQPSVIRLRATEPPLLCITDFATARIAEFDVEASRLRQTSRYMAPEAIAAASTPASDWWSLGIILLELLTEGRCFAHVHERAFLLHLVARGITLPEELTPRWHNLLEGLLTRNHENRWLAAQALRWAEGEENIPTKPDPTPDLRAGSEFTFAGRKFTSPAELAFAAAEEANWAEALAALDSGRIANWLSEMDKPPAALEAVRKINADQRLKQLHPDFPLALALAALTTDLPICIKGEFVTPNALLADPGTGAKWLAREPGAYLRRLKRPTDHWLILLADRAARVRSRAKDTRLKLDEEQFAVLQLATSAAALDLRWVRKRALFPDSDHPALAGLIDRRTLSDEDLLLLASASFEHFRPAEEILREAESLAEQAGVPEFAREAAAAALARPRREITDELDARVPGFERCGRPSIDAWMDIYRAANRRMPLSRLLVVLSIPATTWAEPPHQDYVRGVFEFLERRVLAGIQRGPLIQMRPTASVLDLTGIGNAPLQKQLLDAIVSRADVAVELGRGDAIPAQLVDKFRALDSKARTYRRDSGLDALYLAFPILTLKLKSDDAEKTRIAPVFLWPATLSVQRGASASVAIGFDSSREVQLNPALETLLGHDAARWQEWSAELLREGLDSYSTLLTALAPLIEGSIEQRLVPLPPARSVKAVNKLAIQASAAIFLAEFASQAIAHDFRALKQKPLEGTALEYLLRLRAVEDAPELPKISHLDRFSTLEADPSQEEAVFKARHSPGLVVQGPPGTGKSQTIVNIITDCLGRGESVLVVCEKKAALDVVQKRLAAEKLGHRIFRIENTQSDRNTILQQLREQVPQLLQTAEGPGANVRGTRDPIASQLDALENDLDAYHGAVHAIDGRLGLSYRNVLSLIARQDARAGNLAAPGLRTILGGLSARELESVIGECVGLAEVWLTASAAGATLTILKPFSADRALAQKIAQDFVALYEADQARTAILAERARLEPELGHIACNNEKALSNWLKEHKTALSVLPSSVLAHVEQWRTYFAAGGHHLSEGQTARAELQELLGRLDQLVMSGPAALVHAAVRTWPESDLNLLARAWPAFQIAPSLFAFLNVRAHLKRRTARAVLRSHGLAPDRESCLAYAEGARFELSVRESAARFRAISRVFGECANDSCTSRRELTEAARLLAWDLDAFETLAQAIDSCPVEGLWPHVQRLAERQAPSEGASLLAPLLSALEHALHLAAARARMQASLRRLSAYLNDKAASAINRALEDHVAMPFEWKQIGAALPHLVPFQTFRLRYAQLSAAGRAVFPELAPFAGGLRKAVNAEAQEIIAALIYREAASAWRDEIETRHPQLRQLHSELEQRIAKLETLDGQMRVANRRLLAHIGRGTIKSIQGWERLWVSGPNAQRLRQVFEKGRELGLLALRPIWLVNPDVVSRMLPLEPGLFDVVIFDEASQMRVVNALPALYRAKRAIVSGDEKQLPPTSFFGAKADSANTTDDHDRNDAWLDDGFDEDGADAEAGAIDPRQLAANERHIKDCEDLLALSRGLLPVASLDIHYRSAYRELIAFSNAAYYGGRLNIPVRRPAGEVRRARPIEVRRIDGLYESQTNREEAAAIVEILGDLWDSNAEPPTVGVVTFNMKQAELIEARLRQRADSDRKFARWFDRERSRMAEGEDVGFFVKNLENVQGDERDYIIFSTTFGRDENGVFKRVFGVLNQDGGERRLNVAVTRAKKKVMLVTSMPTAEISSFIGQRRPPTMARDYLQAYMRYAELIHDGELEAGKSILAAFDSTPRAGASSMAPEPDDLVLQAFEALEEKGFAASIMPPEDAFSLDIAVANPESGLFALGVEFDSLQHPLLRHARAREVWRPKLLERSGLRLHRIVSSAWVQDRNRERERLISAARQAINEAQA